MPVREPDRAWVDPHYASVGSSQLDAFYSWHMPGAGEYVVGVTTDGLPIPQPLPQIQFVGQSGQSRVDNSTAPGRGWIYLPFGTFPPLANGIAVATAPAGAYQSGLRDTLIQEALREPGIGLHDLCERAPMLNRLTHLLQLADGFVE